MTADLDAMVAAAHRLLAAHGLTVDGAGDNDRIISPAITSARDVLALAAALRTERAAREAAEAQHAALAGAVRAEREARRVARLAQSERDALEDDAWPDGDDDERAALAAAGERLDTAEADHDAKRDHLTALLAGAPCGYVEARVVREYLRARDAHAMPRPEATTAALRDDVIAARTALDAALLAATTTPKESL